MSSRPITPTSFTTADSSNSFNDDSAEAVVAPGENTTGGFWGFFKSAANAAQQALGSTVNHAVTQGFEAVKGMSKDACRELEEFRNVLNTAYNTVQRGQTIPSHVYSSLEQHLTQIEATPSLYLKKETLTTEETSLLREFLAAVQTQNIPLSSISAVYDLINQIYLKQLGEIGAAIVVAAEKIERIVQKHVSPIPYKEEQNLTSPAQNPQDILNSFFNTVPSPSEHSEIKEQAFQQMIRTQSDICIENIVRFLLAKALLPKGINPLQITQGNQALDFKKAFFAELDNYNVSLFHKWTARLSYPLLSVIIHFYVSHFVQNLCSFLLKGIEQQARDDFQSLIQSCIQILYAEFAKINGGYAYVANHHTEVFGTISSMLEEHLQHPRLNGQISSKQINTNFVNACIDQFMPLFTWTQQIKNGLHISSSPFVIFNGLLWIAGLIPRLILYPIQTFLNSLAKRKVKQLFHDNDVVQTLRDSSREALLGKNYAHTVDLLCIDLLKQIKTALMTPQDKDPTSTDRLSERTANALAGFMEHLLDALHLHAIPNATTLRSALNSSAPLEYVIRKAKPFIIPRIVESLSPDINTLLHAVFNKTQMLALMHTSIKNINESVFTSREEPTKQQQQAAEAEMKMLLEQIVTFMIDNAIDKQLKWSEELQQIVNKQFARLRELSQIESFNPHEHREELSQIREAVAKAFLMPQPVIDFFNAQIAALISKKSLSSDPITVPEPKVLKTLKYFKGSISTGAVELAKAEAHQIPHLLKEPFFLRAMVSRLMIWFATGKATQ